QLPSLPVLTTKTRVVLSFLDGHSYLKVLRLHRQRINRDKTPIPLNHQIFPQNQNRLTSRHSCGGAGLGRNAYMSGNMVVNTEIVVSLYLTTKALKRAVLMGNSMIS
ncbi:hypothetical protein C0993_009226, partial [Termitomyces sp. T159_Od127]